MSLRVEKWAGENFILPVYYLSPRRVRNCELFNFPFFFWGYFSAAWHRSALLLTFCFHSSSRRKNVTGVL